MDLKVGHEYIVRRKTSAFSSPMRMRVIEITKTTYLMYNIDSNVSFREMIKSYKEDHDILEELGLTLCPMGTIIVHPAFEEQPLYPWYPTTNYDPNV